MSCSFKRQKRNALLYGILTNAFQKILDEHNWKPNKTWVDKGSEFYNRSMK